MLLQNLIDILEGINPQTFAQGSWPSGKPYPARFFTYWNTTSDDHKHYDNAAFGCAWTVEVNCYSGNPATVLADLEEARKALIQAGWRISGKGYSVASDTPTHTGRGFTAVYLEI